MQTNSRFSDLEDEAFNSFNDAANFDPDLDAASNYDPDMYTGRQRQPRMPTRIIKANFDLVFTNATAQNIKIEIFNALNSFTLKQRTDLAIATYSMIPHLTKEGLAAANLGIVGYNSNGDLIATSTNNALPDFKLSYSQFSYRALVESTRTVPFRITAIRMTTSTDAQIDNEIVHFSRTFLGGKSENTVSPRIYFKPEQFQSKIIDIPMNNIIDGEKGLLYLINAGETVKWNVAIESYEKFTVK